MSYLEDRLKRKQGLLPPLPTKKPKKPLNKVSPKKKEMMALSGDDGLDLFFEAMRKKLKGKCLFCNLRTTWKDDYLWRCAIAHLLPKSKFKSVATNENNWVELCWNCHTEFDNAKITWLLLRDSKEWDILKEKLFLVLPMVSPDEQKNKLYDKLIKLVYDQKNS